MLDAARDMDEVTAPITQRTLSESLRRLESAGLVTRTVPPAVEYAVTPAGRDLLKILGQVGDWVDTYR